MKKEVTLNGTNGAEIIIPTNRLSGGASGMTQIDRETFIGVYDLKSFAEGPRVVKFKTIENKPIGIYPISIKAWNHPEGKPSDLESICRVPGSDDEFLMAEAGTWQGGYGRLFHLSIDTMDNSGEILGVVKLPFMYANDFDMVGDQYEGMACLKTKDGQLTVILAERGGSKVFSNGILRWGNLELKSHTLTFSEQGLKGFEVNAPGNWIDEENKRDITSLHIDNDGTLWASASQDLGDSGPFYSVIYQLGKIRQSADNPIEIFPQLKVWREVSGYKIEALSGPSDLVPTSKITFATEDEAFGGNWRAIN